MKRSLVIALLVLVGLLWVQTFRLRSERAEKRRYRANQTALMDSVVHYRTAQGHYAASVQRLELTLAEIRAQRDELARVCRDLGVKVRRLETAAVTATRTELRITAPLEAARPQFSGSSAWKKYGAGVRATADSVLSGSGWSRFGPPPGAAIASSPVIPFIPTIPEVKVFHWSDRHVAVSGVIRADSVCCRVESIDTLRQIVHRVPRRFLFIRWGTKAIRQEVVTSNPHTRIVYTEYIELKRRR